MKRAVFLLACASLVGAACSDDLDSSSASTASTAIVEPTTAAPDTTSQPAVDTPDSTEPPATEPPASSTAAALVPVAICTVGSDRTYFGYDNQSDDVVVVAEGPDNVLVGADPVDEQLRPTVFAPGRVEPAFMAFVAESGDAPVSWELTGPDGITRTAVADDGTPECDLTLGFGGDDPRTPALEVVSLAINDARDEVTVAVELTGVPELSVCHSAFDPEPATIRLEDVEGLTPTEGTTASFTAPVRDDPDGTRVTSAWVVAVVVDRCSYEGTTFGSWPAGNFPALLDGVVFCIDVPASGDPELSDETCRPPFTGGAKIRNG